MRSEGDIEAPMTVSRQLAHRSPIEQHRRPGLLCATDDCQLHQGLT